MSITRYKYPSETLVQAACRLYGILRLHGLVGVDSTLLIGRRCDDDGTPVCGPAAAAGPGG
ncbi:hypothetical protein GCM10011504_57430 [Siccirubricoccus deserti]|nr:hypothetical protein GCM10011504_57430 [Siccirubricoccus deserti]